jgi:hypothetical protein
MVGRAYPTTNLIISGVPPYSVSATGLPAGMSLSATGDLSGTPTTAGTYTLNVSATDSTSATSSGVITLVVNPEPVVSGAGIITEVGQFYIVVNGGLTPTNVNVYYPENPEIGVNVILLNGANLAIGTFVTYTGSVDALGGVHSTLITIDVAPPVVTFISTLANGKVGVAYTSTNLLLTGVAPYSVSSTGLPAGMSVSTGGLLSGTPTATGTHTIALSATDSVGTVGSGTLTITIAPADIVTPPTSVCGKDDDRDHRNNGNHYGWQNGYGHRDGDWKHDSRHKGNSGSQVQKVEGEGKITSVTSTSITIKNILIRITSETDIDLKKKNDVLKVGMKVEYEGVKNADGSITACEIEQD